MTPYIYMYIYISLYINIEAFCKIIEDLLLFVIVSSG